VISWRNENSQSPNVRREQVVTLQDDATELIEEEFRKEIFKEYNERAWGKTSRNIPIIEVENKLLALAQTKPFVDYIRLEPSNLDPRTLQDYLNDKDSVDAVIGADGARSFIRKEFEMGKAEGKQDWAMGIAFKLNVQDDIEKQKRQLYNIAMTLANTRYLMNSFEGNLGYLNIRLTEKEFHKVPHARVAFNKNERKKEVKKIVEDNYSIIRTTIFDGLKLFNIPLENIRSIVRIPISIQSAKNFCSVVKNNIGKKVAVFLIGDAAFRVHFWPGRGMNSGIKAAIALARRIFWATEKSMDWKGAEILPYKIYMKGLREREQEFRSDAIADIDLKTKLDYERFQTDKEKQVSIMIERILNWAQTMSRRRDQKFDEKEFENNVHKILNEKILEQTLRILVLSESWPVTDMNGPEWNPIMCTNPSKKTM